MHELLAAERILAEALLHQRREPIEALAHVGHTSCQPHMHTRRRSDCNSMVSP